MNKYKCPNCDASFAVADDLYHHIEKEHHDMIPKNYTAHQYYYQFKTGKSHGNCVVCKMETKWNEATGKYFRFCEKMTCKDKYKEEFKKRMIGKYGRTHLLNDPEQQKKMLANRSISGKYIWSDGKEVGYTGTYELDFLKLLDNFFNFSSEDIISPSPHTYYYMYEGHEKFYIPDFFIPSLNLEIEIKDGGDNPNTHGKIQAVDKVKEKLKDEVLTSQKEFSYIKIVNKHYDSFFEYMYELKKQFKETGDMNKPIFIVNESYNISNNAVVTESSHPLIKYLKGDGTEEDKSKDNYNIFNSKAMEVKMEYFKALIDEGNDMESLNEALKSIKKDIINMKKSSTGINIAILNKLESYKEQIQNILH